MDRIQQVLVPERLSKKLHRAGFHSPYGHRDISMASNEDDRNPDARIRQLALKLQAVNARKSHIQNETTWFVRPLAAQEFLRRSKGLGTQANRLQHTLYGRMHEGIVINYVHCGSFGG